MNKSKRIFGLDLLRAIAILFVVAIHGIDFIPSDKIRNVFYFIYIDGVGLFFVLSGFLIGKIIIKSLLFKEQEKGLFSFWFRRWFRTIPTYFLVLSILIVFHYFLFNNLKEIPILKYFIFIQNFNSPHPYFFGEAWSLSVEEWFYIIIPILYFFFVKILKVSNRKALPFLAFIIIFFCIGIRAIKYQYLDFVSNYMENYKEYDLFIRKQVLSSFDMIMYGVLASYVSCYRKDLWGVNKKPLALLGFFLLFCSKFWTIATNFDFFSTVMASSLFALGASLTLPFFSQLNIRQSMFKKIITRISLISYSLYLVHSTLIHWTLIPFMKIENFIQNYELKMLVQLVLYWTTSIIVSLIIHKYFEIPFMKLRDNKHVVLIAQKLDNKVYKLIDGFKK